MEDTTTPHKPVLRGALTAGCPRWRPIGFPDLPVPSQDDSVDACTDPAVGNDAPDPNAKPGEAEVVTGKLPR